MATASAETLNTNATSTPPVVAQTPPAPAVQTISVNEFLANSTFVRGYHPYLMTGFTRWIYAKSGIAGKKQTNADWESTFKKFVGTQGE